MKVIGVLLAGGRSSRMGGGDKCLRSLGGKPLLARVIERARPQVAALALNVNGDPARFQEFRLPIIADSVLDFAGPLAGVLAGLDWAAQDGKGATHLASFATDTPFLPRDLVSRLVASIESGTYDLACAASAGLSHPVFGLWPIAIRGDLRRALLEDNIRKVDGFTARYRLARVEFPHLPVDPFFNANRPEDLAEAERILAAAETRE